jgi:hypothetical protein
MSAAALLERLDGVRRTGPGTWRARCPSHGSKSLTLAIREADDGKVLLKCFAECSVDEVVGAVGLKLEDLFPPSRRATSSEASADHSPLLMSCSA